MDPCRVIKNSVFTTQRLYQPFSDTPSTLAPGVPARYNRTKLSTAQREQLAAQQRVAELRAQQLAQRGRGNCC